MYSAPAPDTDGRRARVGADRGAAVRHPRKKIIRIMRSARLTAFSRPADAGGISKSGVPQSVVALRSSG
jgi:hypothetical protein